MNSKKKARTCLHGNTSSHSQDITTTPKIEPAKQNLLTSCRRVGLNRKRIKSLGVSPIPTETNENKNVFVEEDLKIINETTNLCEIIKPTTVTNKVQLNLTAKLSTISNENSEDKPYVTIRKKKVSFQRKRKIISDEDQTTISDLSHINSRTDSPSLNTKKAKQNSDSDKTKDESLNQNVHTIPVSINLTRCDLNALKIKLTSPKMIEISTLEDVHQENKENLPTIRNEKAEEKKPEEELAKETAETGQSNSEPIIIEDSTKENQLEKTKGVSPVLILKPAENNSLEDNSDGSDFYPDVLRRKKKKVLTNKQRNTSKPGPSQQKENVTVNKRISANNTPCYSDSDDDFVATPVRRDRKSSVKSESNSQNSVKEESGKPTKKKLKLKKPVEDELKKTGHIRISENKSYTIIHKDNCVSYVKSFDNDVNFKVTESDDNQQLPVRNSVKLANKSMIIERKDYIPERRDSSCENAQILMEMPSIFTDIMNNVDSLAQEFQNKPVENESQTTNKETSKTHEKICVIETIRLQNNNTTLKPQKSDSNIPVREKDSNIPEEEKNNSNISENEESTSETAESENNNTEISENDSKNSETSRSPLQEHETSELNIEQLTEELAALEANIEKKQKRLQRLQRISVYKDTQNLEELREVTLQIKRGCQNALVDFVLNVKQQSNADFTMATLLEFMKIPNELVGYNEEEDNFI